MSPWQLEHKSDPRKPQIDSGTRTRNNVDRDERENGTRPDSGHGQPITVDDGE